MLIVYYSHAKNTHRFIERHLAKAVSRSFPDQETLTLRVFADSPRSEVTSRELKLYIPRDNDFISLTDYSRQIFRNQPMIFVSPTYGQFNHEAHRAENFTPEPMKQIYGELAFGHPSMPAPERYIVRGGNRTFGADFCRLDYPFEGARRAGVFELSGSETEATLIAQQVREFSEAFSGSGVVATNMNI